MHRQLTCLQVTGQGASLCTLVIAAAAADGLLRARLRGVEVPGPRVSQQAHTSGR